MCGIAGWLAPETAAINPSLLGEMSGALRHRGPDAGGHWHDGAAGIALGHRRLSVIDTSAAGEQPMHSACGRYVVVFNGEIYNFRQLRAQLSTRDANIVWRGGSDTEVLLAAVTHFGLDDFLHRLDGMFALAVWDRHERRLLLARDRLGEKPLYYGCVGGVFAFASELKALAPLPGWTGMVDLAALGTYFRYGYVPAPLSIHQGVFKLLPGHCLMIRADRSSPVDWAKAPAQAYWRLDRNIEETGAARFAGSEADAIAELERHLQEAIARQMVADVPLGAFLSGGVDSSTTVALMQKLSARPIETFTIGFDEAGYDEAPYAKAVARHLGTAHTELYVSPREAMDVIADLPRIYDEPFADSSQIPTYLLCRLARRHVTVSLSGDGGDELFGGYHRYQWTQRLWSMISRLPRGLRAPLAGAMRIVPPAALNGVYGALRPMLPRALRFSDPAEKWRKAVALLRLNGPAALYGQLISQWLQPEEVVRGMPGFTPPWTLDDPSASSLSFAERMMRLDALTYLPDDILVKVDRAAMAVSLETRVPMLDRQVVEFAWRLPAQMKLRDGVGKWILRQVLYRHVPPALVERPKMGFGVPIESWLRGPLRDWAESLLDERVLRDNGLLDPMPIRQAWADHLSGRRNRHYELWVVLMFQAWQQGGCEGGGRA